MQQEILLVFHIGTLVNKSGWNITMKPFIKDQLQDSICQVREFLLILYLSFTVDNLIRVLLILDMLNSLIKFRLMVILIIINFWHFIVQMIEYLLLLECREMQIYQFYMKQSDRTLCLRLVNFRLKSVLMISKPN